jgi:mRNA-degrading endonuclease RelE of RelBE toxin-antitoxin system
MRNVRVSKTALDQLNALLTQGIEPFGVRVVAEKRNRVYSPIARTPFVVLYDFDDSELRVHFIFHRHADLGDLDPTSVEW